MSIELDPVELGFRRPFDREVEETLRLHNPNSDPVAFKVKTTAPKQYCVRPNSGRIEAGQNVEVSVLLQSMKEEPPLDAKCRDKFLVQSVAVPADQEFSNVQSIWSNIDTMSKSSIQEKKIRVNFLPATGATTSTPARQTSTTNHAEAPPAYTSPTATNGNTPQQFSSASKADSRSTEAATTTATDTSAVAGAAAAIPQSTDDLKAQLSDAKAQIEKLTKQAQEQTLRQRKTGSTGSDAQSTARDLAQQAAPNGVQVPLVAVLCLLSFLLAYFMF